MREEVKGVSVIDVNLRFVSPSISFMGFEPDSLHALCGIVADRRQKFADG